MTLFIKPCRIIDSLNESQQDGGTAHAPGNWIELESSVKIEDAEIPLMVVMIHHFNVHKIEEWLLRPRDFEKARDWVFDTRLISRDDKPRMMWLLNTMEEDPELYLHLSW